jgi:hypothetical protein
VLLTLLSGARVRMQVVDTPEHPGSPPVRLTIPSVTGGPPPSGAGAGRAVS